MERIATLEAFWPFYLAEHRAPLDRVLHFVGTSIFLGCVLASFAADPLAFGVAFAVAAAAAAWGAVRLEPRRPAFVTMAMVGVPLVLASPVLVPVGIVAAYGCAWVGHFAVEKNRPASFRYPVWSLLCDFRMWGRMARGQLWTGDPVARHAA